MADNTDRSRRDVYFAGAAIVAFAVLLLVVIFMLVKQLPTSQAGAGTSTETKAK